jgi:hypothetical protein
MSRTSRTRRHTLKADLAPWSPLQAVKFCRAEALEPGSTDDPVSRSAKPLLYGRKAGTMSCDIPCLRCPYMTLEGTSRLQCLQSPGAGLPLEITGAHQLRPVRFLQPEIAGGPPPGSVTSCATERHGTVRGGPPRHLQKGGLNVHEITRRTRKLHVNPCHARNYLPRKTPVLPLLAAGTARCGRGTPAPGKG